MGKLFDLRALRKKLAVLIAITLVFCGCGVPAGKTVSSGGIMVSCASASNASEGSNIISPSAEIPGLSDGKVGSAGSALKSGTKPLTSTAMLAEDTVTDILTVYNSIAADYSYALSDFLTPLISSGMASWSNAATDKITYALIRDDSSIDGSYCTSWGLDESGKWFRASFKSFNNTIMDQPVGNVQFQIEDTTSGAGISAGLKIFAVNPMQHAITVTNGTAKDAVGQTITAAYWKDKITLSADASNGSLVFGSWSSTDPDVTFSYVKGTTAEFSMPDHDVSITAVYKAITTGAELNSFVLNNTEIGSTGNTSSTNGTDGTVILGTYAADIALSSYAALSSGEKNLVLNNTLSSIDESFQKQSGIPVNTYVTNVTGDLGAAENSSNLNPAGINDNSSFENNSSGGGSAYGIIKGSISWTPTGIGITNIQGNANVTLTGGGTAALTVADINNTIMQFSDVSAGGLRDFPGDKVYNNSNLTIMNSDGGVSYVTYNSSTRKSPAVSLSAAKKTNALGSGDISSGANTAGTGSGSITLSRADAAAIQKLVSSGGLVAIENPLTGVTGIYRSLAALCFGETITVNKNVKVDAKNPLLTKIELNEPLKEGTIAMKIDSSGTFTSFVTDNITYEGNTVTLIGPLSSYAFFEPAYITHVPDAAGSEEEEGDSGGDDSGGSYLSAGWIQDTVGWKYRNSAGIYLSGGWFYLPYNGRYDWYYFRTDGYMETGWLSWTGRRYYLNPVSDGTKGRMMTGEVHADGNRYYFSERNDNSLGALEE
jgi:hypothetical protein